jgi:mRNA interferase MazF
MKKGIMELHQGNIYWIKINEENDEEIIHPHVIIQDDILNNTRIETIVVCGISSNMKKAYGIGNVVLEEGEANLKKKSIVVVSQVSTVNKDQVGEYIGTLRPGRIEEIFQGMKQQQSMNRREVTNYIE